MDEGRRAFLRGRKPAPKNGVARIEASCLALRGVDCRVCGDACEPRALRFKPRLGGVPVPQLDAEACTGCGDCVGVCPTQAISMTAR